MTNIIFIYCMDNEIKQIIEPINDVKDLLTTATWSVIHVTFSAVSKIMDFVPKWYFLEIVRKNAEKIEKTADKKDLPDIVKNTLIVAGILWNPAMIAILNLGFLLPKDYMPKPAGDFRDSVVNFSKDKYGKMRNYLWFSK